MTGVFPVIRPEQTGALDLVIVTGLSGAGRSTVAIALEDVGYYVVDNLPESLVTEMVALAEQSEGAARRMAMVLDIRSRAFSADLVGIIHRLRARGLTPRVLYLDASDEVLVRRYESARRRHPLQGDGRLSDSIARERELLAGARGEADLVIDTSELNVNQLRTRAESIFGGTVTSLVVTALSFGYKYGLPGDADIVMDMRFLPNPHWIPELRALTGQDRSVSDYVLSQPGAAAFIAAWVQLIGSAVPGYEREGKRYLTVAVGCTGGKHRSVATAEETGRLLAEQGLSVRVQHRDLGRE